jgi:hypothetical protein
MESQSSRQSLWPGPVVHSQSWTRPGVPLAPGVRGPEGGDDRWRGRRNLSLPEPRVLQTASLIGCPVVWEAAWNSDRSGPALPSPPPTRWYPAVTGPGPPVTPSPRPQSPLLILPKLHSPLREHPDDSSWVRSPPTAPGRPLDQKRDPPAESNVNPTWHHPLYQPRVRPPPTANPNVLNASAFYGSPPPGPAAPFAVQIRPLVAPYTPRREGLQPAAYFHAGHRPPEGPPANSAYLGYFNRLDQLRAKPVPRRPDPPRARDSFGHNSIPFSLRTAPSPPRCPLPTLTPTGLPLTHDGRSRPLTPRPSVRRSGSEPPRAGSRQHSPPLACSVPSTPPAGRRLVPLTEESIGPARRSRSLPLTPEQRRGTRASQSSRGASPRTPRGRTGSAGAGGPRTTSPTKGAPDQGSRKGPPIPQPPSGKRPVGRRAEGPPPPQPAKQTAVRPTTPTKTKTAAGKRAEPNVEATASSLSPPEVPASPSAVRNISSFPRQLTTDAKVSNKSTGDTVSAAVPELPPKVPGNLATKWRVLHRPAPLDDDLYEGPPDISVTSSTGTDDTMYRRMQALRRPSID